MRPWKAKMAELCETSAHLGPIAPHPKPPKNISETGMSEPSEESPFLDYFSLAYTGMRVEEDFKLAPEATVSISSDLNAVSRALASASVKSFDHSTDVPTRPLPRSSIFNHKEPFSTRAEQNRLAGDPTDRRCSGKAVQSGRWYWLRTRSSCVQDT